MRLVEGIGCEFLPVGPYLVQHVLIISVLLAPFDKLGFHGIYYRLFLLTHRLTQGVTLTTREIGQQTREQHHLLLINGDAVGIFQIPFHHGNGICNLLLPFLTRDERRDVVHGTGAVKGIHGDEIFKLRRTQLAQIVLHAGRLKLERADGAPLLVKLISQFVVNGNLVEVDVYVLCQLHIFYRFLQLRQGLQPQEVHLDQSCFLNHMAIILRTVGLFVLKVRVIGR